MAKHWMRGLLPKRILLWFLFLFSILFSFASLSSLAIAAPFASTDIGPVVNQLNQDTTLYQGVVFCTFSWPYMVKWHNSGIINFNIAPFFGVFSKLWLLLVFWPNTFWMFESFFATQVRVLKKENTNLLQSLHTTLIEVPLSFQACHCPVLIWNRIISLLLFTTAENAAQ